MRIPISILALLALTLPALAQDDGCDANCQAARKAANPLADVRAIMTDNTYSFETGSTGEDSYNFQLQPVYAIPLDGANLVLRGIIPFQGAQPQTALPPITPGPTPNTGEINGIGDSIVQAFYAPTPGPSGLALGYGLQVSLPTHSDDALAGAGWGAGPAFVIFGQAGNLSWGGVLAHMWGENDYSVSILQPIINYGLGDGWYVGYNNVISYNWKAPSGSERMLIPIGLMAGRTFVIDASGTAMDVNVGYYTVNRSPQGGPNRQFKFGVSVFF